MLFKGVSQLFHLHFLQLQTVSLFLTHLLCSPLYLSLPLSLYISRVPLLPVYLSVFFIYFTYGYNSELDLYS